jgi:hypothetical protein
MSDVMAVEVTDTGRVKVIDIEGDVIADWRPDEAKIVLDALTENADVLRAAEQRHANAVLFDRVGRIMAEVGTPIRVEFEKDTDGLIEAFDVDTPYLDTLAAHFGVAVEEGLHPTIGAMGWTLRHVTVNDCTFVSSVAPKLEAVDEVSA